jgi:hypothetical protein
MTDAMRAPSNRRMSFLPGGGDPGVHFNTVGPSEPFGEVSFITGGELEEGEGGPRPKVCCSIQYRPVGQLSKCRCTPCWCHSTHEGWSSPPAACGSRCSLRDSPATTKPAPTALSAVTCTAVEYLDEMQEVLTSLVKLLWFCMVVLYCRGAFP